MSTCPAYFSSRWLNAFSLSYHWFLSSYVEGDNSPSRRWDTRWAKHITCRWYSSAGSFNPWSTFSRRGSCRFSLSFLGLAPHCSFNSLLDVQVKSGENSHSLGGPTRNAGCEGSYINLILNASLIPMEALAFFDLNWLQYLVGPELDAHTFSWNWKICLSFKNFLIRSYILLAWKVHLA